MYLLKGSAASSSDFLLPVNHPVNIFVEHCPLLLKVLKQ